MASSAWACAVCTYEHSPEQAEFLSCAVCGATRDTQASAEPPPLARKRPRRDEAKSARKKTWASLLRQAPTGTPVTVRRHKGEKKARVEDSVLDSAEYPVFIRRNALPAPLAERLLAALAEEAKSWQRHNWVVFNKTHVAPRTSCLYRGLRDDDDDDDPSVDTSPDRETRDFREERVPASLAPVMREAADLVDALVDVPGWRATMVLANRYANGDESVAKHSDFLGDLGPRAIVAGLSLGAERTFRVSSKEGDTVIDVPTPHNSLVVMKPGCQEHFNHEIPKCATAAIKAHATAGTVRFSLTFRMERKDVQQHCGRQMCHCGKVCGLKSLGGKYFFFCNPAGATAEAMCHFRKACPWAEQDALRLLRAEEDQRRRRKEAGRDL